MSMSEINPKDPIEESRKRKDQQPLPFPPEHAEEIAPGVYQDNTFIYVGDKL